MVQLLAAEIRACGGKLLIDQRTPHNIKERRFESPTLRGGFYIVGIKACRMAVARQRIIWSRPLLITQ